MGGDDGFPRRKGATQGLSFSGTRAAPEKYARPSGPSTPQALDVARYVSDMTAQLEAMAIAAQLDMLAYFLGMAKAESELLIRTNSADDQNIREHPADDDFHVDNSFE